MNADDVENSVRMLKDRAAKPKVRQLAAQRLASQWDSQAALSALLQVALADDEPMVSRAVGMGVAAILIRRGEVHKVNLADFSGPAYLGFDEVVAKHQKAVVD